MKIRKKQRLIYQFDKIGKRKGDNMIKNSNTIKEEVQEKSKETFQNMCFIGSSDKKKTTLLKVIETGRLRAARISFSDYDFIRLFLAYLRKYRELFFDRVSLPYELYPFLGSYEELFQDIPVKKQIEGNYLEIQDALQTAIFSCLVSVQDCGPNATSRLILMSEEESQSIIKKYDKNVCLKMESLVKEYLKNRHMSNMMAADFRDEEESPLEESNAPIRILKRADAEHIKHMKKMILKKMNK